MTRLQQFQKIAIAEGFSWIGLIITMVLKYQFEMIWPNKIVGWIHGILFIAFCIYLAVFFFSKQFSFGKALILFIAAFVPFGTFWAEKKYLRSDKITFSEKQRKAVQNELIMKWIKRIFFLILMIIAAVLVIGVFAPKKFKLERSVEISLPKDSVYNYLKFLKNQDQFSVWARQDPKMKKTYTGTDGTIGFVSAWESKDENVGTGSMEIVKLTPGERIDMHLRFKVPFENEDDAYFETSSINDKNTRVIWGFEGNSPYPWNALTYLLNFDEMIGKDLDGGLKKLKSVLEK